MLTCLLFSLSLCHIVGAILRGFLPQTVLLFNFLLYRSTSENRRSAPCTCVDLGTDLDSRSIDILFYDLFSSASFLHGGGGGGGCSLFYF